MRPSRTRLIGIGIAVVAVVAVALLVGRGGGKRSGGGGGGTAAGTGGDPWAASADDPAAEAMRRARRNAPGAGGWLRARPAGPPVVVTGVVRMAPGGAPVAGAEVAFMNETGENTAAADGSGRYSITVASNVPWRVHARTESAVGYPESFVPTGDAPVRDLDIHPTATVRGRVLDSRGAVVPGAEVSLFVESAARNLLESAMATSSTADDAGRFELQALPGAITIKGASGQRQGVATLPTLAPGETAEVDVTIVDPIAVSGRVVDGKGEGVGGAKVLVAATISTGGPTEKSQVESKPDGTFALTAPAGWLRLEARRGGEVSPASMQWVDGGKRLEDVILTLAPPSAMRGKVVTTDGTPVAGAKIRLYANAVYDTTTAMNGTFEASAPAGQAYIVRVRHSDGTLDRQVAAWNGEEVFVMRRFGHLRVVAEGAGELTVTVDSFIGEGEQAPRAPVETRFRGVGGSVRMPNLEPGVYDLTVTSTGAGSVRLARVAVAEGTTRDVPVKLSAPVAVRGSVKSGNQPVSGARVAIGAKAGFSDSKGRWAIADVAPGPIAVVVTKAGFGSTWVGGTAGEEAGSIDIELRPASDAAGLVEGVGVVLAPAARGAVVTRVLPGSPADGKLMTGDVIEEVGGTDVTAASLDEIVARVRGDAGSSVSIELRRGDDEKTVDVVRKRLVVPTGTPVTGIASVSRSRRRASRDV